jgi:CheY-like chemotaxis protein
MPEDNRMYRVECLNCQRPYDAEQAAECDCLEQPRSLRCPHCAGCFCKAPQKYKTEFWANAPRELWSRRKSLPESAPAANATPAAVMRPLVLFADDDPVGRAIARRVIGALEVGVIVASDGDEALWMAREYQPEIVITDAFMPKLDGREVARIIKDELPKTKVVVISGLYKDPRYKHEAMRDFKVDDYLTKPVSPAALREAVVKQLGDARPPKS